MTVLIHARATPNNIYVEQNQDILFIVPGCCRGNWDWKTGDKLDIVCTCGKTEAMDTAIRIYIQRNNELVERWVNTWIEKWTGLEDVRVEIT